ncbi:prolipoprotein diacylglyceryl transferase [Flavobacterium sp.]|jgi:prolipoprotein diacylglyceryl transferase|uniref:prolipoprotein diacylglyceryl transferase n=1 Tax=Flavobacterium sp. TaxID=239 RepID=UPI0037BEBD26
MVTQFLSFVWNPSEGFEIGSFTVRFYSLMFVIAFGLGWYIMKYIFVRENESLEKLDSLFIYTVIATLIGARLGHVIFYQPELFREDPLSIFLPIRTKPSFEFTGFSGLASHGAAIAIILFMVYFSKKIMHKSLLWVLDRVVIPVASGAVFVRLGNFFNSEIVGHETTSSFGIKFVQDFYSKRQAVENTQIANPKEAYKAIAENPQFSNLLEAVPAKHPSQLYEAIFYIIVFLILFFMYWKTEARKKEGLIFGTFMVLLWSVRFGVEYLKESQGGFESYPLFNALTTGQWLSIPFILIGFYFIFRPKKV